MNEIRKITAILAADAVGFSRLAGADEDGTLAGLRALRSDLVDPTVGAHHGRVVKRTGDGLIVEFRSVVDAVRCSIEIQNGMVERNAGVAADKRIEFRIGVHLGDVVEEADGDLMGDGINIAARLESIAEPGAACLSGAAYEQVATGWGRGSPILAKWRSRNLLDQCGSMRWKPKSQIGPPFRLRRIRSRRVFQWWCCRSRTSGATQTRSTSSTA
jgi:class 3 adenylate cyclase